MITERYLDEIQAMCNAAGMSIDVLRLRGVLSKYTVDEIDRFVDACHRFRIENMLNYAVA